MTYNFKEEAKNIRRSISLFFFGVGSSDNEGFYYPPEVKIDPRISKVTVEEIATPARKANEHTYRVTVFCERPGFLIGRGGETLDKLTKYLSFNNRKVNIAVKEYHWEYEE